MDGDDFELDVTVPVNTTATVHVPAEHQWAVTEGGVLAAAAEGVEPVGYDDGYALFEVGSGSYAFATAGPVLGALGGALHVVGELEDRVAELRSDGGIARGPGRHLDALVSKLAEQVGAAVDAFGDDDERTVGRLVQHGLVTTEQLQRWLAAQARSGVVDDAVADDLTDRVQDVAGHLSNASAALFGAVGGLDATPTDVLPGHPVRVEATVENTGGHRLTDVDVMLERPDGWALRSVGPTRAEVLAPGETFTAVFEVTPPVGQALGAVLLEGEASYRRQGGLVRMPLAAHVTVVSPVTIASLAADRASVEPGETATVTATLRNRSDGPADADVAVQAPAGWAVDPETASVTLDGDARHDLTFTAAAPVEASEGPAELAVVVLHAGEEADRASVSLPVVFDNPPAEYHDHVDAGNPESEAAHNVQASPTSATEPPEAGHTRRYTHIGVPDAYFQYDMAVEPGEPFVVRAVETYDGPQTKDYYVYVNGVRVHERDHQRTASGAGTVTYQFVVDDVSLTTDGVVTVRFQEDEHGANHDPSIADVWTTPVP